MLNSVQFLLKNTLNGLTSPQMTNPLQAVIQPPVDVSTAGQAVAYVWAATVESQRISAPRPLGFQRFTWPIDVSVVYGSDLEDPNVESAFPLLLDQIIATLATMVMPLTLTDPDTGFQTQIVSIGEKMNADYARVRVPNSTQEGIVKFGCDYRFHVEEDVQFLPGGYYTPQSQIDGYDLTVINGKGVLRRAD